MKKLLMLGLALVVVAGCGKAADKAQEVAIEKAIESGAKASGGNVDVDVKKDGAVTVTSTENGTTSTATFSENGGQVSVKGADGEMVMTSGADAKIPEDYPKDIPQYAGVKLETVMSNATQAIYTTEATTADALDTVVAWYKQQLGAGGWNEEQNVKMGGDTPMNMFVYSKEGRQLMITVSKADNQTRISCAHSKAN